MERSLSFYRERLEAFHREHAELSLSFARGNLEAFPLQALFARYREWSRPEAADWVRDFRARPGEAAESSRWERWQRFVVEQLVRAHSAPTEEEIARLERRTLVPAGDERLAVSEVERQLPLEPLRTRRASLERGLDLFATEHASHYAPRWDAHARAAEELGDESALTGEGARALLDEAQAVLSRTDDAYRDLLGYVLHKIDARLGPLPSGEASRHDLLHAAAVVPQPLAPEELMAGVEQWLKDIGWWPLMGNRIRLELEDLDGRAADSAVIARRVPGEIYGLMRLRPGWDAGASLLRLCGLTLGWAHLRANAPAEDRWLPDRGSLGAWGELCSQLLTDETWLRRYFRFPQASAREVARVLAFQALTRLRGACGALPVEVSLLRRGPSAERADEFEAGQRRALAVAFPRGAFWREATYSNATADGLRGVALGTALHSQLREQFNEDFWRNPETRFFLDNALSTALLDGPDVFAKQLGQPLSLVAVGDRLERVMAA